MNTKIETALKKVEYITEKRKLSNEDVIEIVKILDQEQLDELEMEEALLDINDKKGGIIFLIRAGKALNLLKQTKMEKTIVSEYSDDLDENVEYVDSNVAHVQPKIFEKIKNKMKNIKLSKLKENIKLGIKQYNDKKEDIINSAKEYKTTVKKDNLDKNEDTLKEIDNLMSDFKFVNEQIIDNQKAISDIDKNAPSFQLEALLNMNLTLCQRASYINDKVVEIIGEDIPAYIEHIKPYIIKLNEEIKIINPHKKTRKVYFNEEENNYFDLPKFNEDNIDHGKSNIFGFDEPEIKSPDELENSESNISDINNQKEEVNEVNTNDQKIDQYKPKTISEEDFVNAFSNLTPIDEVSYEKPKKEISEGEIKVAKMQQRFAKAYYSDNEYIGTEVYNSSVGKEFDDFVEKCKEILGSNFDENYFYTMLSASERNLQLVGGENTVKTYISNLKKSLAQSLNEKVDDINHQIDNYNETIRINDVLLDGLDKQMQLNPENADMYRADKLKYKKAKLEFTKAKNNKYEELIDIKKQLSEIEGALSKEMQKTKKEKYNIRKKDIKEDKMGVPFNQDERLEFNQSYYDALGSIDAQPGATLFDEGSILPNDDAINKAMANSTYTIEDYERNLSQRKK